MKTMNSERRSDPRYEISASIRYASYQSDEAKPPLTRARTVDASKSGLQVSVSEPVDVPAYVQIALHLPDRTAPAIFLGKTVWCRPEPDSGFRAGIQFMGHIDPALSKYLETINS